MRPMLKVFMVLALSACLGAESVAQVPAALATKPKPAAELDGLTYGATKLPTEEPVPFFKNEWFWTAIAGVLFVALNIYFW